jgi:hypothetical protein
MKTPDFGESVVIFLQKDKVLTATQLLRSPSPETVPQEIAIQLTSVMLTAE